ncbi:MAG: NTPase [Thermoplasmata archaeon]|jgi:nucleoside-triphosphatase|nr:NTPase [Thermoplasmata archaeon]MVT13526.1 NTPase [Euryarchaeota archaeon]MVT14239.1 NTPase [Euryarchaeota archaeon]MVT35920.1 NTPase [Euryarchaeota archaeon]
MYVKIGISGLPGVGKTTTLIKTVEILEKEYTVGGIITEEILENKTRVGFTIMDWSTKEKKVFASKYIQSRSRVSKYGIDTSVLDDLGVRALENAKQKDIIIIDEIGKMELESKKLTEKIKEILEMEKNIIMTLNKKSRNPLLQDIRRMDDVRILEVTPVNRTILPYKIVGIIKGEQI